MSEPSTTPLTDAFSYKCTRHGWKPGDKNWPDFARALETALHQLAAAGKEERGASDHLDYSSAQYRHDLTNDELSEVVSAATMRLHQARTKWDEAAAAYDALAKGRET